MELQHIGHEHPLVFIQHPIVASEEENEEYNCLGCGKPVEGWPSNVKNLNANLPSTGDAVFLSYLNDIPLKFIKQRGHNFKSLCICMQELERKRKESAQVGYERGMCFQDNL
ncbi:hypothetical protein V6N13_064991 [Hibiscus sabdariffa]